MEIFVTGLGAVIASLIVFCGGVWLVLSMVTGGRLAYFIVATVTLGFLLIMGIVWSLPAVNPLGPVGELPTFDPVALAEGGDVDFSAAGSYPEGPWHVPDTENEAEQTKASELENAALDYVETAINEGEIDTFEAIDEAQVVLESSRLLEQEGEEYGAVLVGPLQTGNEVPEVDPTAPGTLLVVMQYDPGTPLVPARFITLGTFVFFVLHLVGLSMVEKKARRMAESPA
ncbi:MAG: hypothetical protein ACRDJV_11780 [Actinomycetota bacterium]